MKFAAYMARNLLCESCKFGEKIFYSNWDNEFLLRIVFYWRTLYILDSQMWSEPLQWTMVLNVTSRSAPIQSIAISVSVCLSVRLRISKTTRQLSSASYEDTTRMLRGSYEETAPAFEMSISHLVWSAARTYYLLRSYTFTTAISSIYPDASAPL